MSEQEEGYDTWEQVKANVNQTVEYTRTVGKHKYKLEFKEINGDVFEDLAIKTKARCKDDDTKFNKEISYELRKLTLISVAGEKYSPKMDREMPVWLKKDLDDFYVSYIQGEA